MSKKQAKIYRDAADLVEKGWTKHASARDRDGMPVRIQDESAVSFCMLGAIVRAASDPYYNGSAVKTASALRAVLKDGTAFVSDYNDKKARSKEEVAQTLRAMADYVETR